MRHLGWIGMVAMVALLGATPAGATVFRSGNTITVEAGEVIDDDLIAAGNDIRIAGKVNGDVILAGQNIQVLGPVAGSAMLAGSKVEVGGRVAGSVRAAGDTVTLSGSTGRNAALAGRQVTLTNSGRVGRDVHAAGNEIRLDGQVVKSVMSAGNTMSLGGKVGGRLSFEGNGLTLGPAARVGGDLDYRTPGAAAIASGATVGGAVHHLAPRPRPRSTGALPVWLAILGLLTGYVFGVVGLAVLPRVFAGAGYTLYSRPWWTLLLGFLVLIVVPAVSAVLLLSVLGLTLGLFLLFVWIFLIVFAGIPVGLFVGDVLLTRATHRPASPYLALFLGLVVLVVLSAIPYVGGVVRALIVLFGLGAYARAIKGALVELRRPSAVAPAA